MPRKNSIKKATVKLSLSKCHQVAKLCCTHLVHQESFCFSCFPCQKVLFFIFLMSFGYPFTSCLLSNFLCLILSTVLTIRRDDHPYRAGSLPT
ncbi:hypothetical protein GJM86_11075 [Vibrio parahaemolyticus]|nr:hypothetical protein [Vibrio parahaemolyticus]EGQ8148297.1 hypothetical protein [Vibrio parahaemolyticus]EGQ8251237.1 hypothetical protein [Vibrio parahaemolyticus]EGQ8264624.1 hypothetical protein [Vibrio parahaemolyticus]EGQ8268501.1 hypothetical protein [Vibrio parahaemolyticus]